MNNNTVFNEKTNISFVVLDNNDLIIKLTVGLTSSLICLLNFPVIFVLITGLCLRKTIHSIHILSLGITDFLIGVLLIPMTIVVDFKQDQNDICDFSLYNNCWARVTLFIFCFCASLNQLCFICVDRLLILQKGRIISVKQSRKRFWIIVSMGWFLSTSIIILPSFFMRTNTPVCRCTLPEIYGEKESRWLLKVWSLSLLSVEAIIVFTCVSMIRKLMARRRKITSIISVATVNSSQQNNERTTVLSSTIKQVSLDMVHTPQRSSQKSISCLHHRAVVTIAILACGLCTLTTPMLIMMSVVGWNEHIELTTVVRQNTTYLATLNSAFNPIIYAFRIPEMKLILRAWKNKITNLFSSKGLKRY